MAFKIEPFGGAQYRGDYADHQDIRAYLGFHGGAKLPIEFSGVATVPLTDGRYVLVQCNKGKQAEPGLRRWRNKSSAHRCFALCPDCGVLVPAGRTHQHKCKGVK